MNFMISLLKKPLRIIGTTVFVSAILFTGCHSGWEIQNPYEQVDWESHHAFKANFHTHTTRSDGRMNPQSVVDRYHQLGYQILSVTDHNEVTWPWTGFASLDPSERSRERLEEGQLEEPDLNYENRDPQQMGILAIEGNELSRHHHMGSYFNNHNGTETEEESLEATKVKNGLTMLNHPGRYTGKNPEIYTVDWYTGLFSRYDHLVGMEVYNQGDRYPSDRELWDDILAEMMPDRPVWGFSNDDMHSGYKLGFNWNVMLMAELTEPELRKAMEEGRFYYVYAPEGHEGKAPPVIQQVQVNPRKGIIRIDATGQDSIRWISAGDVVHKGNLLNLKEIPEIDGYVRAEIYGPGAIITGIQPFGIARK
jgi:hypothetical protein